MSRHEVFLPSPGAAAGPTTQHRWTLYFVTELVPGEEAHRRGADVAFRFLGFAEVLPPDCILDVTIGRLSARRTGMRVEVTGTHPLTLPGDLRWVFENTAVLVRRRGTPLPAPRTLYELSVDRVEVPWAVVSTGEASTDAIQAELQRQRALKLGTPWPRARYADLADLLRLNRGGSREDPRVVVRYRVAPAGPVDRLQVSEQVHHLWDPEWGDPHEYVGRPVRLRAFVGSHREALPGRVAVVVRQWANGISLRPVPDPDIEGAWSGDALSLAPHAVPFGAALALLRLPAAVDGFPGISTSAPTVPLRVLDPVPPAPSRGFRLGRARTVDGAWTDVHLGLNDGTQHVSVFGGTGSGKSTLLAAICLGIQAGGGSYTLLDPEGSTVDLILRQTDRAHADAVSVIRHGDADLDVPLNLLATAPDQLERALDLFAEMIQLAQDPGNTGMVGPRWRRWFNLVARATALVFGADATLVTVAAISGDMDRVRELAKAVRPLDPDLAHRLSSEYGRLSSENSADLVSWGVSKLGMLLSSERARWIFGAGPDAVDVRAVMDEGMSLLVDLGAHRLGEPVGRIVGVTYLLKFWAALSQRQRRDRLHFIVIDEAHLFSYGPLPKLLAEARKFGVGIVVATQHLGQLTRELSDALESNAGSFICLRAGLQSANRASARLDGWPVHDLVRLPNLTAAVSLNRDGVLTAPFSLVVDHHQRVLAAEAAGRVGADVADGILTACRAEVTAAYDGLRAPTDQKILAGLRRASPEQPGPPELDEALDRARPGSVIDDWLAPRSRTLGD